MYLQSVFIYGTFKIQTKKKTFQTRFPEVIWKRNKNYSRWNKSWRFEGWQAHPVTSLWGGRLIRYSLRVCYFQSYLVTPPTLEFFTLSTYFLSVEMLPLSSINAHQWCVVLQEDVINTQCGYDVRAKPVSLVLVWRYTRSISVSSAFCTSPACFWETIYHRHNSQSKGPSGWPVIHSYTVIKSFKRL